MQRSLSGRVYYGWIVVGVTAVTLITSAGERSVPGVLIHPLEQEFGWSAAAISVAISIGLLLFGLMGSIAGRLMDRSGPRRLMVIGLLLIVVSTSTSAVMTQLWQLVLLWGVVSGIGTGMVATVLGAAVANRWFVEKRGLVMGIFGGGNVSRPTALRATKRPADRDDWLAGRGARARGRRDPRARPGALSDGEQPR